MDIFGVKTINNKIHPGWIDCLSVVHLLAKPLNKSEAENDLDMMGANLGISLHPTQRSLTLDRKKTDLKN